MKNDIFFNISLIFKGREHTGNSEMKRFSISAKSENEVLRKILKKLKLEMRILHKKKAFGGGQYFPYRLSKSLTLKIFINPVGNIQKVLSSANDWFNENKIYLYKLYILSKFPRPEMGQPSNDLYWEDKAEWEKECAIQRDIFNNNKEKWYEKVKKLELSRAGLNLKKQFLLPNNYCFGDVEDL